MMKATSTHRRIATKPSPPAIEEDDQNRQNEDNAYSRYDCSPSHSRTFSDDHLSTWQARLLRCVIGIF